MRLYEKLSDIACLRFLRFPLPFHFDLEREIYMSLLNSYRLRYIQKHYSGNGEVEMRMLGDEGGATNCGFNMLGFSGCGKSSGLAIALSNYPQVILHQNIEEKIRFTQIVYLVVNCVTNSNFNALYAGVGNAIDKALGYNEPYFQTIIEKQRNLGAKASKVQELIEQFAIGIIIFDEIQLIDFNSTRENSFESLMTLSNRTKVAIGAVGTEDAYEMMFNKPRTGRRLGATIKAGDYCSKYEFFEGIVEDLFEYQWFDDKVEATDEIIEALYENCKGIIDLLIGLYTFMQVDYVMMSINGNKPVIDAKYINKVMDRHYKGLKEIMRNVDPLDFEKERAKFCCGKQKELDEMIAAEKAKINTQKLMVELNSEKRKERNRLKEKISKELSEYTDFDYQTIESVVIKEMSLTSNSNVTENELKKKVHKRLCKMGENGENAKTEGLLHEQMRMDVLGE